MPPESPSWLTNIALSLGIVLTVILILNGLLDMPAKFRNLRKLWRK